VRETLKDHSVFVNLGHTYCEIRQYARAIENVCLPYFPLICHANTS
jgi:hypothetical protein